LKIRKFVTAATAAAVLAAGAVVAPAASALDLKVEGDICEVTESYPGEYDDLDARLVKGGEALVKQLKKRLPDNVADIDLVLSGTADEDELSQAVVRIETAARAEGFDENEAPALLQIAALIAADEFLSFEDETIARSEAAAELEFFEEIREILRKNANPLVDGATSSDPAVAVFAKTRNELLQIFDTYIKLLKSCEAGKSGTFLVEKPGDRDHDDAFNRSVATSSY
jgi:hypothetical protein